MVGAHSKGALPLVTLLAACPLVFSLFPAMWVPSLPIVHFPLEALTMVGMACLVLIYTMTFSFLAVI